ncbi:hypothetical protein [Alkalimarinus coralli]|uniref:hypothetical protein n=1 Tax=Alkalimarinus coralli TaxID=2935863 RepID=UPI00202B7FE3|nr:hypothetical protein [Alkalimarinus coralli]
MSRKHNQFVASPNDAINSYIGDLLWSESEEEQRVAPDNLSVTTTNTTTAKLQSLSNTIKPGFWLIPLTNLDHYRLDLSRPQRSLNASFALLLSGLLLLKCPISGRVREAVVEQCHERMMEYRLLCKITRLPSATRRFNES